MSDFERAFLRTMGEEGGIQFNPDDKGNTRDRGTYRGIAPAFTPNWPGWKIIDRAMASIGRRPEYEGPGYQKYVSALNSILKANTELQGLVKAFYRINFWLHYRVDRVYDQELAEWLFDHVVNGGGRGVMWLQEAAGVKPDGDIGPVSLQAINTTAPAGLLQEAEDVAAFYRLDRAAADPSQIQFLPSWLRRDGVSAAEIKEVMQMAKGGLTYTEVAALKKMIAATA
jgi:lysozyme family protein